MRHPMDRFMLIEILSIAVAFVFVILALAFSIFMLFIIGLLLISISLICDALIHLHKRNQPAAFKQILRATALFLITILIIIFL